jgi:ribonucleotide monophosphatase NagD (HAD superfamily)
VKARFPKIEAVVLFGEPLKWETSLQLLIDVLMTNGNISSNVMSGYQTQDIPVLACNMDLMWMGDNPMPRFAHGMFLNCLESVYEKVVGRPLKYRALLGKPSITTYYYAEHLLLQEAAKLCVKPSISTLYAIGDNPLADIFGANLYKRKLADAQSLETRLRSMTSPSDKFSMTPAGSSQFSQMRGYNTSKDIMNDHHVKDAQSVLVCTGIYSPTPGDNDIAKPMLWHCPRDVKFEEALAQPDKIVNDVDGALDWIFEREEYAK